jgi:hypothetical protein
MSEENVEVRSIDMWWALLIQKSNIVIHAKE